MRWIKWADEKYPNMINPNLKKYRLDIPGSTPEISYIQEVLAFSMKDAIWKFLEDPNLSGSDEDHIAKYVKEIS